MMTPDIGYAALGTAILHPVEIDDPELALRLVDFGIHTPQNPEITKLLRIARGKRIVEYCQKHGITKNRYSVLTTGLSSSGTVFHAVKAYEEWRKEQI